MGDSGSWLLARGVDPLLGGIAIGFIAGWVTAHLLRRGGGSPAATRPDEADAAQAPPGASPLALSALRSALRSQGVDAELAPAHASHVLALLQARQKLEAIKLLRAHTGLGLKETKDVCDEVERDQGWAA